MLFSNNYSEVRAPDGPVATRPNLCLCTSVIAVFNSADGYSIVFRGRWARPEGYR